jgi:hypothetical protein
VLFRGRDLVRSAQMQSGYGLFLSGLISYDVRSSCGFCVRKKKCEADSVDDAPR